MELPLVEARQEIINAMEKCPNRDAVTRADCPLCVHLVRALNMVHKAAAQAAEVE